MSIAKGQILQGKVSGITNFGAFVQLPDNITGLVHISEVADSFVKDINEILKVGDEVKVKVLNIDDGGKIGLSIRQAIEKPKQQPKAKPKAQVKAPVSFEDKISRFMKDSDEKLASLNKNMNAKRRSGNRY